MVFGETRKIYAELLQQQQIEKGAQSALEMLAGGKSDKQVSQKRVEWAWAHKTHSIKRGLKQTRVLYVSPSPKSNEIRKRLIDVAKGLEQGIVEGKIVRLQQVEQKLAVVRARKIYVPLNFIADWE